ncbi:unnamed protein product, partial [Meganyctiphanes norvegica]
HDIGMESITNSNQWTDKKLEKNICRKRNTEKTETEKNVRENEILLKNRRNPWPYIDQYYKFNTWTTGKSIQFLCDLCSKPISCGHDTRSNLKQHMRNKHLSYYEEFLMFLSKNRKKKKRVNKKKVATLEGDSCGSNPVKRQSGKIRSILQQQRSLRERGFGHEKVGKWEKEATVMSSITALAWKSLTIAKLRKQQQWKRKLKHQINFILQLKKIYIYNVLQFHRITWYI